MLAFVKTHSRLSTVINKGGRRWRVPIIHSLKQSIFQCCQKSQSTELFGILLASMFSVHRNVAQAALIGQGALKPSVSAHTILIHERCPRFLRILMNSFERVLMTARVLLQDSAERSLLSVQLPSLFHLGVVLVGISSTRVKGLDNFILHGSNIL